MKGDVRTLDLRANPDAELTAVVEHLRGGGVVAYPTETVYGLGGTCTLGGIRRVQDFKGRRMSKPLIVLVESRQSVQGLRWTESASELADIFWPGAVTLVLEDPEGLFPPGVRDEESGSVAVRVTPHPIAARLVAELGVPLTSTSLNRAGEPPVLSGHEAEALCARLGAPVFVLDAGTLPPSGPSTVVDCTGVEPVVLREGVVPIGRLRCAVPEIHGQ